MAAKRKTKSKIVTHCISELRVLLHIPEHIDRKALPTFLHKLLLDAGLKPISLEIIELEKDQKSEPLE